MTITTPPQPADVVTVVDGDWCRRWTHQVATARHPNPEVDPAGERSVFTPSRYRVSEVSEQTARTFTLAHHYAGTWPAAVHRIGLTDTRTDALVGVAVFAVPMQARVLTSVFPGLDPYRQSLELARFVLLDDVPANAETWFLARAHRLIRSHGIQGIVSYADPMPRYDAAGALVKPGHAGITYQAGNAVYTGRGSARTLVMLPDGQVLTDRALGKVRRQETGATYVHDRLVQAGATPWDRAVAPRDWLEQALTDAGATRQRHPGNYRYAFPLSPRVELGLPALVPYPKPDQEGLGFPA